MCQYNAQVIHPLPACILPQSREARHMTLQDMCQYNAQVIHPLPTSPNHIDIGKIMDLLTKRQQTLNVLFTGV
jgi:hypothetical protein